MFLVLAFGDLTLLEACSRMQGLIEKAESPCPRIGVLTVKPSAAGKLVELAGIHKWGPLLEVVDEEGSGMASVTEALESTTEKVRNLSLSGYDLPEDTYESLVRSLLDSLKDAGFSKVRLLRPKGNELMGEQVVARGAVDVAAFPYHDGYGVGPTMWVQDSLPMRERGSERPSRSSEISMSPRLAKLLVNLAGVFEGQTILDPFCGSGTILAEALVAGYRCIGVDSNHNRLNDARRNLNWLFGGVRTNRYRLIGGDARKLWRVLDREKVHGIVTEPLLLPSFQARPRTQTAGALLAEKEKVYADALASMADALVPGGRIVIVVPIIKTIEDEEVSITLDGRPLGLRLYQPGPVGFEYPVRPSFESTRWVRRGVYVFESRS